MNILILNDTRVEKNPGCHATVNSLIEFIKESLGNVKIETLPLGQDYNVFVGKNFIKSGFFYKIFSKIKICKANNFNYTYWKKVALKELSIKTKKAIDASDIVVVNMEGTIHNNNIGALTLLAMVYYSKHKRKKVAMVNGSYFNMNHILTKKVLSKIDFLSVREPASNRYLKSLKINSKIIPDFAFKSSIFNEINDLNLAAKKKCLYTSGVLGVYPNMKGGISIEKIKNQIIKIKELGYQPYFLIIEPKEEFIVDELIKLNVETIYSYKDGFCYSNLGTLLKHFDLLVTGRYHVGIFGLMSNVKTIFLPSNSDKVIGVLELVKGEELFMDFDFQNFEKKIKNIDLNIK
jgi:polysaccharide pyruvyl transferase WcaK-like protein